MELLLEKEMDSPKEKMDSPSPFIAIRGFFSRRGNNSSIFPIL
jgi:hypothetical protein